jgi:hypothetical protein
LDSGNPQSYIFCTIKNNNKYGYINETGTAVTPLIFDVAFEMKRGLATVQLKGKWGCVDKNGKIVIPCIYDSYFTFSTSYEGFDKYKEGVAFVKLNGKEIAIDTKGTCIKDCN